MKQLKIDEKVIGRVLNHLPEKLIRTYDQHDYMDEKREALTTWTNRLNEIIEEQQE